MFESVHTDRLPRVEGSMVAKELLVATGKLMVYYHDDPLPLALAVPEDPNPKINTKSRF